MFVKRDFLEYFFLVVFIIFIDQISKMFIYINFEVNQVYRFKFLVNLISLCYITNSGLVFGLLSDFKYIKLLIIVSRVVLIFYLLKLIHTSQGTKHFGYNCVSFCFICGGGISNTIDLFIYNAVIDIFYFDFANIYEESGKFFSNVSFNFADVFIIIGLLLSIYTYFKKE